MTANGILQEEQPLKCRLGGDYMLFQRAETTWCGQSTEDRRQGYKGGCKYVIKALKGYRVYCPKICLFGIKITSSWLFLRNCR